MRKIKHYKGTTGDLKADSWNFHTNAINRLDDGPRKTLLASMEAEIHSQYDNYVDKFQSNTLEQLQSIDLQETIHVHPKKDALQYQYSFKKIVFADLFKQLSSDDEGRQSILCPNCQAEPSHTLDHCIPKGEFPEYSDHPLNLMLCCQDCNGRKSSTWRQGGKRTQLNLYLDDIPDIQYLFVNVSMVDGLPFAEFEIHQTAGISDELYEKIKGHYGKPLELCKVKYVTKTYDALSNLRTELRPAYEKLPPDEAKASLMETVRAWQIKYGRNYWLALLLEACANKPDVWLWFMTKEEDINPQVANI